MAIDVVVSGLGARSPRGVAKVGSRAYPCALGKGGRRVLKREGDGATPIGQWRVEAVYRRVDRWRSVPSCRSGLPTLGLRPDSGWCDAPADRNYNRFVRHPYPTSAERMWRADGLYDVVVVLGYNTRPRIRGLGSAIFLHLARPGLNPTEGCIAVSAGVMRRLLPVLTRRSRVIVRA